MKKFIDFIHLVAEIFGAEGTFWVRTHNPSCGDSTVYRRSRAFEEADLMQASHPGSKITVSRRHVGTDEWELISVFTPLVPEYHQRDVADHRYLVKGAEA